MPNPEVEQVARIVETTILTHQPGNIEQSR